jgi:alanine racemase
MRPTEATVDLGAIGRNVERLVARAAPAQVCAVTKADGYGHGSVATARAALDAGATWIAVALVEEGIELRESGVTAPILLLSEPRPAEMFEVVESDLTATLYSSTGLAALVSAADSRQCTKPVDVHLNLDTGMNRVGLRPAGERASAGGGYVLEAVRAIAAKPDIRLGGVWTHLAVADEPDRPETAIQLDRFRSLLEVLRDEIDDSVIIHAANSAGLLAGHDALFDMVRVGIGAYGLEPAAGIGSELGLEPAMTLTTQLSMVKRVFAGEAISYGFEHVFDTGTVVGTIPMGYADGLRRDSYRRGGQVIVGGKLCPIIGVVTMDQAMIDLGQGASNIEGDPVVIIGKQGAESISVHDIAVRLDTIPYEIVCDIGRRVRRRYI